MDDLISRQTAISLPVKPKEDRYFQTQNLDDAYEYGWWDLQRCIEKLPSAQPDELAELNCSMNYEGGYHEGYEQGYKDGQSSRPERKLQWG